MAFKELMMQYFISRCQIGCSLKKLLVMILNNLLLYYTIYATKVNIKLENLL